MPPPNWPIRREQERQQRVIEETLRAALRKLTQEGATQEEADHHSR